MKDTIFHLAFPVNDLEATRRFYVDGLGCTPGRASKSALALNLGGHQLVAHLTKESRDRPAGIYPQHFGLIFKDPKDWEELFRRAKEGGLTFYREKSVRFEGKPIEHRTFFLVDPSENLLEFKHYTRPEAIFGETQFKEIGESYK